MQNSYIFILISLVSSLKKASANTSIPTTHFATVMNTKLPVLFEIIPDMKSPEKKYERLYASKYSSRLGIPLNDRTRVNSVLNNLQNKDVVYFIGHGEDVKSHLRFFKGLNRFFKNKKIFVVFISCETYQRNVGSILHKAYDVPVVVSANTIDFGNEPTFTYRYLDTRLNQGDGHVQSFRDNWGHKWYIYGKFEEQS